MFNWIYEHVVNTIYFVFGVPAFLFLVLLVFLFIIIKTEHETEKQK
jgi:hypothetical protein